VAIAKPSDGVLRYDGKQWRPIHCEDFTEQFAGTSAVRSGNRQRSPVAPYQSNLRATGNLERLSLDLHDHEFCSAGAGSLGVICEMTRAFRQIRSFGRSNAGSSAVEFAIAAPILFVLMFAVIEFGRAWWTKNALQYAIERAARYAVVCSAACPSDGQVATYAANQVYDQSIKSSVFQPRHPDANTTCIDYNYTYSPWFVGSYEVLSGATTMQGTTCRSHL
jgi:hypothetical protein